MLDQPADRVGRIVLVDNSPSTTTADLAREKFPTVRVVRPGNVGFGAGANLGIVATSDGEPFVAVLNGDTELRPGALPALIDDLVAQRRAAVAGPRLVSPDGSPQPSVGRFPTPWRVLLQQSGAWRLVAALPGGERATPFVAPDGPSDVPWVLGAALLLRRRDVEGVAGFDPGYRMYFEEVDLCRRLADRGRTTRYVPAATAVHVGGASTRTVGPAMERELYASLARHLRLHGPDRHLVQLRPVVALTAGAHLAREAARACTRDRAVRQAERAAALGWARVVADAWHGWRRPGQRPS